MPDSTSSVFRIFRGFIVLAVLIFAGIARAELVGPVVGVLDGDTIDVLVERQPVRVRLAQIDGTVAKLAMRQPFVLFKGLTFQKLCLGVSSFSVQ